MEVYYKGEWSTVCSDHWKIVESRLVCEQLGYYGGVYATEDTHVHETWRRVWLVRVTCYGFETALQDCVFSKYITCKSGKDAGVICGK